MGSSAITTLGDPAKGKSVRKKESLLLQDEVGFSSLRKTLILKASFINDE